MKKIIALLFVATFATTGCAWNTTANQNEPSVTAQTNTATVDLVARVPDIYIEEQNGQKIYRNLEKELAIAFPADWSYSLPWMYGTNTAKDGLLDITHADPERGFRESEIVYENEGVVSFKMISDSEQPDQFQTYRELFEGTTELPLDTSGFANLTHTLTKEESLIVAGYPAKQYVVASRSMNTETPVGDDNMTIIVKVDSFRFAVFQAKIGIGSSHDTLQADVIAIANSFILQTGNNEPPALTINRIDKAPVRVEEGATTIGKKRYVNETEHIALEFPFNWYHSVLRTYPPIIETFPLRLSLMRFNSDSTQQIGKTTLSLYIQGETEPETFEKLQKQLNTEIIEQAENDPLHLQMVSVEDLKIDEKSGKQFVYTKSTTADNTVKQYGREIIVALNEDTLLQLQTSYAAGAEIAAIQEEIEFIEQSISLE
ncbi:MAG: hypothetical protein HYV32_02525 [Candidatus Kerfeldbacteria bacterium]|nr:hypothetical protein [Candidatus Kerfeldbacteria bacterium]